MLSSPPDSQRLSLKNFFVDPGMKPQNCRDGLVIGTRGNRQNPIAVIVVENSELVKSHIPQIMELLKDDNVIGLHPDEDYKPFGMRILTQKDIRTEEISLWEPTIRRFSAELYPSQSNKEIK
jgi:hypothetical protein